LITILHEHIRFVGEFLSELRAGGLTREELRKVAVERYHLGWSGLDQVNRRFAWLQATGLIEHRYDHKIVLTKDGNALLETLSVMDPIALDLGSVDVEVDPTSLPVADSRVQQLLDSLTNEGLLRRSAPGMYIPKGHASRYDSLTSLRIQLDGISPRITKDDYLRLCAAEFNSEKSSAISALDTLRHAGLVQQTGFSVFDTTSAAHACLESEEDLDLVRTLHAHIRCVGELIPLLNEANSIGQLIEKVYKNYGIKLNTSALRQRLQILRECELVDHASAVTYLATGRGRAFASTLPLETPISAEDRTDAPTQISADETSSLAENLHSAARDSKQPRRFEESVVTAFRMLGLSAEHLGGSGDTDVLVTINENPTSQVKVIVDAKATSHTSVLESAIDFTTLEEHRRQHDARYIALVAVGFEAGRIIKRARDKNVALITIDRLVGVLARHDASPLAPLELLALFDTGQGEDLWAAADRRNSLMAATTRAIAEEAEYVEESGESFSAKDIHKSVRREIDPAPSMEEIRHILNLLASPLIGGVIHDGREGYRPGATAEGIAARLRALGNAAAGSAA
jgi:type III secretion system FlhB-like substrate exporter